MKVVLGHSQVTTEAWKTRPSSRGLLSLIIVVSVTLGALHSMAEDEIDAGHTAAGKLKVNHSFSVLPLEASVFPGIIGYATGEVGFHSVAFDEPGDDFFQLSSECDCRLVLLAKDPGVEVWNVMVRDSCRLARASSLDRPRLTHIPFGTSLTAHRANRIR